MTDLADIGARLLRLASDAQRPAAESVLGRARERRLRVLVAGEAKRGKSTLLNRLLGRDLLPTGVLPVTAVSTTVQHGPSDQLVVHYLDGRAETQPIDALARFVTERANPENKLRVAGVEVVLADSRLAGRPVELVDTPGTGSVFEHNTRAAETAYATLDAVIMVVTATPPMNAAERELLGEVSKHAVKAFLVLNKADQLTRDELDETIAFTAAVCAAAGVDEGVYPMSARAADEGFARFRADFEAYLHTRAEQDSERAIRGHALRLAESMRDEAAIELRAFELGRGETRSQLAAFRDHVAELAAESDGLSDRCYATERRLRRELDEDARRLSSSLAARARDEITAGLAELPDDLPAADVERHGRDQLERIVTDAVLTWRSGWADRLEDRLGELVAVIERDRARQLTSLREQARDQLQLEIAAGVDPLPLHPGRLFWLDFTIAPAVELPAMQALRTHGPRATQRARNRVLDDVRDLTDRQVGRARADLQQRLGETTRQLVAALRIHHVETLHRLGDALGRATDVAAQSGPDLERQVGAMRDLVGDLESIIAAITTSAAEPPSA